MQRKWIIRLLLPVLVWGLCCHARAAELPDPERPSSVTFIMEFEGTALEGGSLSLYRVGQIGPDGRQFVPVDALAGDCPSLENLQDPALAETLHDLAIACNLQLYTAPIRAGQAVFSDLKPGLYVVGQQDGEHIPGYAPIDHFIISLPQWQGDTYLYDLTAAPKVPLVPEPTEPTQPPPTEPDVPPDLPQTGQLNWPVPVMAVFGMALFALGWGLFFSAKRRRV